jgi:hypothetical protein
MSGPAPYEISGHLQERISIHRSVSSRSKRCPSMNGKENPGAGPDRTVGIRLFGLSF